MKTVKEKLDIQIRSCVYNECCTIKQNIKTTIILKGNNIANAKINIYKKKKLWLVSPPPK